MSRDYIENLLEHVKDLVRNVGEDFAQVVSDNCIKVSYDKKLAKEIKSNFDTILEKEIISGLLCLNIPILSEEAGFNNTDKESEYLLIVDPLDGTFNFVKELGPYAVSVALWHKGSPVFGVIYNLLSRELVWGSGEFGSYCNNKKIKVSEVSEIGSASLCTGFPARYNFEEGSHASDLWNAMKMYSKVRMLGSAAISLVSVAKGAADVYTEKDIMIWDVAAGIPIVEGAGGEVYYTGSKYSNALHVFASNGVLGQHNFFLS